VEHPRQDADAIAPLSGAEPSADFAPNRTSLGVSSPSGGKSRHVCLAPQWAYRNSTSALESIHNPSAMSTNGRI
jgi:hypothetical protein